MDPPPSAYRATADWINENMEEKETVWVMPSFSTYPLMYHAPKALYAWQLMPDFLMNYVTYTGTKEKYAQELEKKREGQFRELPDIHFYEQTPPEYVIAFGPQVNRIDQSFDRLKERGVLYEQIEQIDLYWFDLIRPELIWHSFPAIKHFSRDTQAIYIFKKLNP